ncbi:hypothetical protein QBC39DRAFT_274984 [Podospora conica]|nr:hypothetical protein QBC39DRAFT_274984 [Schizothecium conicum]
MLVIALDFGTTFSGIAYSFKDQKDPKVVAITNWPGAEGQAVPKIPTVISYSDYGRSFKWGASVNQTQDDAVSVKLLLDPSQEQPSYLPAANHKRAMKNLPKPPVEIAADFMGAIYQHALSEISKTVPKAYFESCAREFVVSVPAIWSDKAKDATRKAAEAAGMSPVTMIKEPEAAALYTMHSLHVTLQVGDAFVLCDAGGGTVDLITYEVVKLEPVLELKELVPGTGSMAGSLGLNQRFGEAVKGLVGEDKYFELRKTKGYMFAVESFDRDVKRRFNGGPQEEYLIPFPKANIEDDEDEGLQANCWSIKGTDLKTIFDPLVTDILRLIDDQIRTSNQKRGKGAIEGIFLVGGFGSSQYLKSRIEKRFPGTQVIQPTDAWAAVVKGAVLSKFPKTVAVMVTSATKHYGIELDMEFDAAIDAGMPSFIHDADCLLRMAWLIEIGHNIQRDQQIRSKGHRFLKEGYQPSDLVFTEELIECSDMEAPTHFDKGDNIRPNCSLEWDARSLPQEKFEKRYKDLCADFCDSYAIPYDFVIEIKSAVMKFSVEMDGENMGSVEAKYD